MAQGIRHQPNDYSKGLVEGMVLACATTKEIAKVIQIDEVTLLKHYREVIDETLPKRKAQLAQTAWRQAIIEKDSRMIMFLCKTQLGWRETNRLEVEANGNVNLNVNVFSALEELKQDELGQELLNSKLKTKVIEYEPGK